MATYKIRPFYPVDGGDNADFDYRRYPQAASQTFKKGTPLALSSTGGTVQAASANPSSVAGVATSDAAGYAWEHNTVGDVVPTIPMALGTQEFRGTYMENPSSAGTAITTVANLVGATFGITAHSSGYWVVDGTKSANNQRVRITAVEGADGDADIPVRFTFLPANVAVLS